MFRPQRQRKPPKGGHKPGVLVLLERVAVELAAEGTVRTPAGPWLSEANILLCIRKSCGWNRDDTPTSLLEDHFRHLSWAWRWEAGDLVLELPGWKAPAPRIVALQSSLFD